MNDKILWKYGKIKNYVSRVAQIKILKRPIRWKKWAGKRLLSASECNESIYEQIMSRKPFAVARMGSIEMDAVLAVERSKVENILNDTFEDNRKALYNNAGMFSNDLKGFFDFVNCYIGGIKNVDMLGVWFWDQEEFLIKKYASQAELTKLSNLEPYYETKNPWTSALKGKKVLVVHPFSETIKKQYEKRLDIWENREILPEFELLTFKAIQTMCGEKDDRFESWCEALNYMETEIKKLDFDIAILGCGAYGLPLAVAIKNMGKQAIHLGGATQILFGIIGKRWEEKEFFKQKINNSWVRPSESEKPKNAQTVEKGCYW